MLHDRVSYSVIVLLAWGENNNNKSVSQLHVEQRYVLPEQFCNLLSVCYEWTKQNKAISICFLH